MEHRHLETETWSAAAIASALERGGLQDWRELFAAVRRQRDVAALVMRVASRSNSDGASILARALVGRFWPGLDEARVPN